ncbi:hypothetical protein [Pseudonocardia alni]|uniref:hypothetical protein n=1 Tax=Pseudonocardia alni TaxID=33907 RepID=UPI00280BA022|nr:hypothetical protein [Pseudonocardia alni]
MWELGLLVFGVGFQLWGALLAYRGFRIGWDDVAAETDKWAAPIIRRLDELDSWFRRITGRKPKSHSVSVDMAAAFSLASTVTVRKTYHPPARDQDIRDVVDLLTGWINDAMHDISELQRRLGDEEAKRETEVRDLDRRLTGSLERQAEEQRQRAVRGIRIEAAGFILLTFGSLLQAVAAFVGFDWVQTF